MRIVFLNVFPSPHLCSKHLCEQTFNFNSSSSGMSLLVNTTFICSSFVLRMFSEVDGYVNLTKEQLRDSK